MSKKKKSYQRGWWISWRDPAPLFVYEPGFGLSGVPYLHRRLRTHSDRRPQERRNKLKEPRAHFLILSPFTAAFALETESQMDCH